jgi:hypothetical protein
MDDKIVSLVDFIVRKFIKNQEKLTITSAESEGCTVITVNAAKEDMGKIIGKQGKIAKAIRTIVKAASFGESKKYSVEIKDAEEA